MEIEPKKYKEIMDLVETLFIIQSELDEETKKCRADKYASLDRYLMLAKGVSNLENKISVLALHLFLDEYEKVHPHE